MTFAVATMSKLEQKIKPRRNAPDSTSTAGVSADYNAVSFNGTERLSRKPQLG